MTARPNIAFIGKAGSGKSTLAAELVRRGYETHSWAEPIKALAALAYGPIRKSVAYEVTLDGHHTTLTGREIIQRIGTEAMRRTVDENFWVRAGTTMIDAYPEHGPYVNDDTRFENEVNALARRGWVIAYVGCPEEQRIQRLLKRDERYDPSHEQHASETSLSRDDAHVVIWNTAKPELVIDTLLETLQTYLDQGGTFVNGKADR